MLNSTNLPLSKKKITKKVLQLSPLIFLIFIVITAPLFAIGILSDFTKLWWLSVLSVFPTILTFLFIFIYQYYYYKKYFYDFGDDQAEIRKGVISRSTGFVRYARIQNIYVDQDILDRMLGLYDVHYETAGETSIKYSHVDGLNKFNSDRLVEFLNKYVNKNEESNENNDGLISSTTGYNNQITGIFPEKYEHIIKAEDTNGIVISRADVPMSKIVIFKNIINSFLVFAIIFFIFTVKTESEQGVAAMLYLSIPISIIVIIASSIYQIIWFKNFYYEFSNKSGLIRSQVISSNNTYIYYDRIQNINVTQGMLDRIFGLNSVTIETAADTGASRRNVKPRKRIEGLTGDDAETLKNFLMDKAQTYRNL
jgi:putative membrane protein